MNISQENIYPQDLSKIDKPKFVITTLTCNNRDTIFSTIDTLSQSIELDKNLDDVYWYILAQGNDIEHLSRIKNTTSKYPSIKFNIFHLQQNMGLSKGMNILNNYVREYKYVMNIEDDWYCLANITGNNEWLSSCIHFMESQPEVSTLFLRRYANENEKERYGWSKHISYICHVHEDNFNYRAKIKNCNLKPVYIKDIKFIQIPNFLFTLNPTIRRNEDYYKCGALPLTEYNDIIHNVGSWTAVKSINEWGWCEALSMEKIRDTITYNVGNGFFTHYEDM